MMQNGEARPLLGDVASIQMGTAPGEVERYNMQRVVSLTANVHGRPLGSVAPEITGGGARVGQPPRGTTVNIRGQIPPLEETIQGLRTGLLLSIAVILLLLIANFQSVRLALAVVSTVPAAVCGVVIALLITGDYAQHSVVHRRDYGRGHRCGERHPFGDFRREEPARFPCGKIGGDEGASGRLRAVLMTAIAMTAGMIPIALGLGEGGRQTAPLGRAVIGGLVFATVATLTVLPLIYAMLQRRAGMGVASLIPAGDSTSVEENT